MTAAPIDNADPDFTADFARGTRLCFFGSGIGFGTLAFGLFLHLATAIEPSAAVVGLLMLGGAALLLGNALGMRRYHAASLWSISAAFYLLAAIAMFAQPTLTLRALTLILALTLGVSGLARLIIGIQDRAQRVLISGCASILMGTAIGMEWSHNSLWMVGSLIGTDLGAQAIMLVLSSFGHRFALLESDEPDA